MRGSKTIDFFYVHFNKHTLVDSAVELSLYSLWKKKRKRNCVRILSDVCISSYFIRTFHSLNWNKMNFFPQNVRSLFIEYIYYIFVLMNLSFFSLFWFEQYFLGLLVLVSSHFIYAYWTADCQFKREIHLVKLSSILTQLIDFPRKNW